MSSSEDWEEICIFFGSGKIWRWFSREEWRKFSGKRMARFKATKRATTTTKMASYRATSQPLLKVPHKWIYSTRSHICHQSLHLFSSISQQPDLSFHSRVKNLRAQLLCQSCQPAPVLRKTKTQVEVIFISVFKKRESKHRLGSLFLYRFIKRENQNTGWGNFYFSL